MKKKIKKKRKFIKKTKKLRKKVKNQNRRKKSKKIKRIKKRRKLKTKTRLKLPNLTPKRIKVPRFIQNMKKLQKITFRKVLGFILEPIFTAYEDFRERRNIKKLRRIAIEKKAREAEIKEERRLRYEVQYFPKCYFLQLFSTLNKLRYLYSF